MINDICWNFNHQNNFLGMVVNRGEVGGDEEFHVVDCGNPELVGWLIDLGKEEEGIDTNSRREVREHQRLQNFLL